MSFDDLEDFLSSFMGGSGFGSFGGFGGGASGNTKTVRMHNREFKQVYRYYGVSQEDIDNKTERFEEVVRTLANS